MSMSASELESIMYPLQVRAESSKLELLDFLTTPLASV
jgi:hypothetical protein